MTDALPLLKALQHGDSFFPSGATSFSSGMETLLEDGKLAGCDDVGDFVAGQIFRRWATFDRPVIIAVMRRHDDLDAVAGIDTQVEAQSLAADARESSKRAGWALLSVHARIGIATATAYLARLNEKRAHGHLPVVQGLVWSSHGFSEDAASALSAHTMMTGLVGAGVRLGLLGHVEAQRILHELGPKIALIVEESAPPLDTVHPFTPMAEIAIMRHETSESRLFMT